MAETIWGSRTHEERLAEHLERLRKAPARSVIELAATRPRSSMDAPFAPIDPALNAAAQQLVREAGLEKQVWLLGQR